MRLPVTNTRTDRAHAIIRSVKPHADRISATRSFLLSTVLAVAMQLPIEAGAACPELEGELIRWVVPSGPGGGYDRYSRLIQPFLEQGLGARIVIENRSEAGGVVGAIEVRDARPDGKTLGIINASGFLTANALLESRAPDPLQDFSILARVVSNRMVVFSGRDSGIDDIRALLELSGSRPVIIGIRDVGSASFFALPVAAALIGLDYQVVTGYSGSGSRVLAVIRGEVDIILQTFDSVSSYVESGEIVPLLELSRSRGKVPSLGGPNGVAALQAARRGLAVGRAIEQAEALENILSAGRLVVAPAGLPAALENCLQERILEVLSNPDFNQAAHQSDMTIDASDAVTARAELQMASKSLDEFGQLVRSAIERARQ